MEYKKENLIKSPLNYTGGKYKLLPQILSLFPEKIDTFIDLFCGGCNVGINVKAKNIICNDIVEQLIDLYESFKNNTIDDTYKHIYQRINEYGLSKTNKEGYLKLREDYNKNKNPLDLYVLICYCYNNQIRFNSKGEFNRAFGMNRSEFNIALESRLKLFIEELKNKNFTFTNKQFYDLDINSLEYDDFIYIDPPYLITYPDYSGEEWNEISERKLLDLLDNINKKEVKFALSNVLEHDGKSNDILKDWSKKYNINYLNHTYKNANADKKVKNGKSIEVLITNY